MQHDSNKDQWPPRIKPSETPESNLPPITPGTYDEVVEARAQQNQQKPGDKRQQS